MDLTISAKYISKMKALGHNDIAEYLLELVEEVRALEHKAYRSKQNRLKGRGK